MKRSFPEDEDDLERYPKRRKIEDEKTCSICLEKSSESFVKCPLCTFEGEEGYCKKCVTPCESCKIEKCEKCKTQCPTLECGAKLCKDCVWGCDGCERLFCGDCVVSCKICSQRYCKKCVEEKKCECFEVEEEEEGEDDDDFEPEDEGESESDDEEEEG